MKKFGYGALFTVVLPGLLVLWAMRLDRLLALPVIASRTIGIAVAALGAFLALAAVGALRIYGNGWPMSPYPPERRVTHGAYAFVANPIYLGAVLITAGVSVAAGSAAGLWVVTPVLAMACIAFVAGYEREATDARFGPAPERPLPQVRLSIYLNVLLPWLVAFYAVNALNAAVSARNGWFAIDARVPVLPWTESIYFLDYAFVLAVPLLLRTREQLRDFAIDGWIATAVVSLFYLAVPVAVIPRDVPQDGFFGTLMIWERRFDMPMTAFPAFHVIWAFIAAAACARAIPRLRVLWWTLAIAITVSCATTGMHAIADIAAGVFFSILILSWRDVFRLLVSASERLANSWREWDLGSVRLMSHGVYAALGSLLGFALVAKLTGQVGPALFVGIATIVGAGLWAQFVEGSPQLLRPFGYFGGVIGCCVAVLLTPDPWLMLAAYAVAGPVIQACGRCRCLVQGCCHGRPAPPEIGIRYRHPRSRVTRLSTIASEPLHPTQLYSILWNAVVFVVLLRLWVVAAPLSFIAGAYFILEGLGRFVEEHFRGEPQTPVFGGLHSYQWLSIASVVVGGVLTCFGSAAAPEMQPVDAGALAAAVVIALFTYAAYGIDFPRLNTRFARLV